MIEYRARIAVVTLAVPLLLIAFTDTVFNRIMSSVGHSGTCLYQLVTEVAPNAEILITGSSRARQSIDPDLVAAMVDLPPHSVVNTAHPSRNLSLDLLMTSHAATGAKLKLVVVELQVGSPSVLKRELELKGRTAQTDPVLRLTSGSYPRDTITTLSFSEAIGLLTQRAASYSLGAYDATNAAFTKLEVAAKLLLSKRFRGLLLHGDADIDKKRLNICWPTKANALDMQNGSERDQTLKKAAQSKYLSDHPNGIYDIPFDGFEYLTGDYAYLDRETARRITVFAQQRGFRIAFFYLPAYYTQIPSPHFQAQFALTIGAPLIVPDHKTLTSLYPYYYDSTHLNINGINLFTRWIVHELKERGLAGRDNKL